MLINKRFAELVTGMPKLVLCVVIMLTILVGTGLGKLTIRTNQDADLPSDDPIVATKERIDSIFGDKTEIMIGIQHDTIYRPSTLAKIQAISDELKRVDHIVPDQINSLVTVNNVVNKDWGLDVGTFIKTIPTTPEQLKALENDVKNNVLVNERLVSSDGTFTVISAQVEPGYDQTTLYNDIYAIVERYQGPEDFHVTGEPIFTQEIDGGIQRDAKVLIPLALLLIMAGLFICFRNIRGVIFPMITIVFSIIWAMGLMGHMGLPQTAVSSALPLLLVTIASSYAIHILIYYYNEPVDSPERVKVALEKVLPSLFLVVITSALGTGSLIVFGILMIKEFAISATLGVLASWFISITVIPALLQLTLKMKDRRDDIQKKSEVTLLEKGLRKLSLFSLHYRKTVIFSYIVMLGISVFGITQIKTGLDFLHLFKEDNQARVAYNVFNDKLAGTRFFNIMVTTPNAGDAQSAEYLKVIQDFQNYMDKQPGVGYTYSIADVVKQISQAVNGDEESEAPLTSEQIAQYFLLYDVSGEPGDFSALVDYDYRRTKIQLMLKTSDPDEHRVLYNTAKDYFDSNLPKEASVDFGGDIILWLAKVDYIIKGKIENIILALLFIVLVVSIAYRSLKAGIYAMTPILFGVILTFAFMGFSGIRLDMPTSIITGLAIGIGIDFSLHYLSKLKSHMVAGEKYEEAILKTSKTSGKAVVFDTFTNMLGFVMLIFSEFSPVQTFGYLVSFTMLILGLSVLILFPALLSLTKPKFIFSLSGNINTDMPKSKNNALESL